MKRTVVMVAAPIHPIPPRLGAAVEWWMWQVSRRFTRHHAHIVCTWAPGYAREEALEGVRFHRLHLSHLYKRLFQKLTRLDPWGYAARAAARIEAVDADLVHVHNDPELFRRLRAASRNPARRYLLHLHNERDNLQGLEQADLIAVSEYLAGWYRERLPAARIRVVTNGVDLEQFSHAPLRHEARLRLLPGLAASQRRVVLFAGRVSPEKGALPLVRALARVMAARDDVAFVLAGEFSQGGAQNRRVRYGEEVRAALAALPAGRALCLGSVSPDRIHEVYACADLVVMPSEFNEPLGMVALEAMAAGAPLLAARRGGLREIVQENRTGFFIPEGGDDALASRILSLLDPCPEREAVVAAARAYVAERHGWQTVAVQLEQLYADV
ncbi:MAG: glycosyltransferase [Betaproteobacteria bacterium]|nr:glycosyltransferase [Betaproteobacteria bacterium]